MAYCSGDCAGTVDHLAPSILWIVRDVVVVGSDSAYKWRTMGSEG